ncbi:uncharacterized protein M421DRAFT_402953 [Didymella exigua CBS 183.55]|uniref:Uncharacterized protein n=1 Tax=Didymella exigua CBS 183.55 TaxID=1150837 RepID=A0A6A5RW79_9PLEO|nr:uncharacterized protein M421DRAFT_402953 [Didymella exigua CBS 183.55]KAF1932132.1 hypothetical protein M421DRAFT_402953 [Didymella exigua CBS 183.55]
MSTSGKSHGLGAIHHKLKTISYDVRVPRYSGFLSYPAEVRNMIYMYVYGDFGVFAEAKDNLARPTMLIELDDVNADDTEKGELVKFGSSYRITGLHHTCRQLRRETEDSNPLWKVIHGTSQALLRIFHQPNPFESLRIVNISLGLGDTVYAHGGFGLSSGFTYLLSHLVGLRFLKRDVL